MTLAPVVTIDGPVACGKGTISVQAAKHLGWHFLDSGALYRALAWAVLEAGVPTEHGESLAEILHTTEIDMRPTQPGKPPQVICNGQDVTDAIRLEKVSNMASKISAFPIVRQALLQRQRDQRQLPGLVADGRDMGTVVFPDANAKVFLTASAEVRAERRYKQLKAKGISVSLREIRADLERRDARDSTRSISPTVAADDMLVIDTTGRNIDDVLEKVLQYIQQQLGMEQ